MTYNGKRKVNYLLVRSILLYGCETWSVRVADERMLEVFDNDSIRRILRVRRRDCVPSVELRRRLCLTSIPALLVQKRLRWFGHAARRPEGELIKDLEGIWFVLVENPSHASIPPHQNGTMAKDAG